MRADAAGEDRIAVVQQVVSGDGRTDRAAGFLHVLRGVPGGDVLEHHFQLRHVAAQRRHHLLDEDGLAVEDIDGGVGHLAVHQQRQPFALHRFQRAIAAADIGHAGIAVGGGPRRVQLDAMHKAAGLGRDDLLGAGVVGQVQRHQRLELHAGRQRGQDAGAVGLRLRHRGHGRLQVGHDDGACELARGIGQHRCQCRAVAQVQVPVVRAGDGERWNHGLDQGSASRLALQQRRIDVSVSRAIRLPAVTHHQLTC
ncbi:hypothetical protein D9M70_229910 [compost metagenome]